MIHIRLSLPNISTEMCRSWYIRENHKMWSRMNHHGRNETKNPIAVNQSHFESVLALIRWNASNLMWKIQLLINLNFFTCLKFTHHLHVTVNQFLCSNHWVTKDTKNFSGKNPKSAKKWRPRKYLWILCWANARLKWIQNKSNKIDLPTNRPTSPNLTIPLYTIRNRVGIYKL